MDLKILDIDMDYFLEKIPIFIPDSSVERVPGNEYPVWTRDAVVDFLENNLGLSKNRKIRGKIVKHHYEALYYWRDLIKNKKLEVPFEVIHVDSHADLGLGYPSWAFIMDSLLTLPVEKRSAIENYKSIFDKYYIPQIGDYLLFALAFRWISKLTYVCNPKNSGDDYVWMILKDGIEPNDKIQLVHNANMKALDIKFGHSREYYETALREPEVDFAIVNSAVMFKHNGNYDYITFCISPNYTPDSADFIIELIKEYILEQ